MEIILSKRFFKELRKCPPNIQLQVKSLIEIAENADNIDAIPDIKKLAGFKDYYRVRLGGYRVGVKYESGQMKVLYILTVQSRGDVYKSFPPK